MFQAAPRARGWSSPITASQRPAPYTPWPLPCPVVPIHAHGLVSPPWLALEEEEIQLKGPHHLHSLVGDKPDPSVKFSC